MVGATADSNASTTLTGGRAKSTRVNVWRVIVSKIVPCVRLRSSSTVLLTSQ